MGAAHRNGRIAAAAVALGFGAAVLAASGEAGAEDGRDASAAVVSPGAQPSQDRAGAGRGSKAAIPNRPGAANRARPSASTSPPVVRRASASAVRALSETASAAEVSVSGPPGHPITVTSVSLAPAGTTITGAINAESSRGLALSHSLATLPDKGGRLTLGADGTFALTPTPSVSAAGGTEQFGVLIAEKTSLEILLEQIPLVGAVVPQVFAALRQTPLAGDLLAPFIGYAALARISVSVPGTDGPVPIPPAIRAAAGWNLYSWQAGYDSVVQAVGRQKPGLVRWFVEMDRFLEDETQPFRPPRPWSWEADTGFDPFFRALAENDTTLVVALWNKDDWAKSMRACDICGWPKIDQYAAFVQDLHTEARKFGVRVIFEALNEPDLRWGSLSAATNIGATENFTGQWYAGLPQGWAEYRGGTGELWRQMHDVVDAPFASGGIISLYTAEVSFLDRLTGSHPTTAYSTRWIDATAPLVDYTSFHHYGLAGPAADYVEWVYNEWMIWRDRKGFAVPFYIGEIGPTPTGAVGMTDAEAARMREIHAALAADPRFDGAYLGMTAHVFSATSAPNLWETTHGWWDPAFTTAGLSG